MKHHQSFLFWISPRKICSLVRSWLKASTDVRLALEEYGCFIVEYNKLSVELTEAVFGVVKELFDLPTETKRKNKYEKPLNGYVQYPAIPLHESLGIDHATSLEATQNFIDLMWPNGNPRFCEYVYKYGKLITELDQMVSRMIFESYGVLEKYYDSHIESTSYLLRLLKNRPPEDDEPNKLGFLTHTDKSFTTVLHQNQVNGLEVDTKDCKKISVEFSSASSFVVIAGDTLMAWSNDRIISPSHRVIMNGKIDRYSLALFAFHNGILQVPEEFVDEEHPLMYKPFDNIGLLYFYKTEEGRKFECTIKAYCGI